MKEKAERIRLESHLQLFLKELADHFAQREELTRKSAVERMQIVHDENLAKFSSRLIYLQPLGGTHVPQTDHQVQTDFEVAPPLVSEPETVPVLHPDNKVSHLGSTSPNPNHFETMIVDGSVDVRPTTPTSAKGKRLNLTRQLDINSSSTAPQVEPESIELESQRASHSSVQSSVRSVSSAMSEPEDLMEWSWKRRKHLLLNHDERQERKKRRQHPFRHIPLFLLDQSKVLPAQPLFHQNISPHEGPNELQMNVAAENPEEPIVLEDETIYPDCPLSRTINILKENLPPMEQTQQLIEDKRQATLQRVPKPSAKRRLLPRTTLSFL
ncbi:hypothetical protein BLNAU_683 [Blattamonas nauphoetae]|uniref:Uncharacterized protein n=1 Tax=Blattamonas nauphoetae TaxID=2049346 RepID=A0ABQ9YK80_9EUKA|nr:hypothetical protein BLNAU_683 [Blattamonas nauphoetae]